MSNFRGHLKRLKVQPDFSALSAADQAVVTRTFDARAAEVTINGQTFDWKEIDEVEVAIAARATGLTGWMVKQMMGENNYHVGIYAGPYEQVLTNVTLAVATYVVKAIAYYAPNAIRYTGVEGLSPVEPA